MYRNLRYLCMKLASKNVYNYTCDVDAHSSLPTSAIIALGLLKRKKERKKETEKMMNKFVRAVKMHFRISGTS